MIDHYYYIYGIIVSYKDIWNYFYPERNNERINLNQFIKSNLTTHPLLRPKHEKLEGLAMIDLPHDQEEHLFGECTEERVVIGVPFEMYSPSPYFKDFSPVIFYDLYCDCLEKLKNLAKVFTENNLFSSDLIFPDLLPFCKNFTKSESYRPTYYLDFVGRCKGTCLETRVLNPSFLIIQDDCSCCT
jgi:hypothetical protein